MSFIYLIVSFGASIVGAISGIGGGVIIKPVLDTISVFSVATISFLSGCTVLSMTTVTLIKSRHSKVTLNKKTATLLALGGIIGGLAGKQIFDMIRTGFGDDRIIGISQSSLLFLLTLSVLFFTIYKERISPRHREDIPFTLLVGFFLGSLASFLGIGGGPINLAVLYYFFSMDSKTAALNSIYIIFFSQIASLVFTAASGLIPEFNTLILLLMITGGISGGLTGSALSNRMTHKGVDKLFMTVMILIIFICLYNIVNRF
ncbi:sulfite exporter TauE/SafE family protein [Oceanispirochaeta crateris]|nr:sulfite exporter TauE/SafE family protein [Oceanispirochaeta crateris]